MTDAQVQAAAASLDPTAWEPGPNYESQTFTRARNASLDRARAALVAARVVAEIPEQSVTVLTMNPGKSMCHCNRFGGGAHDFNPGVLIGRGCPAYSVPEPVGEPSEGECLTCGLGYGGHMGGCPNDAVDEPTPPRVEAAARAFVQLWASDGYTLYWDQLGERDRNQYRDGIHAALRAAGGIR